MSGELWWQVGEDNQKLIYHAFEHLDNAKASYEDFESARAVTQTIKAVATAKSLTTEQVAEVALKDRLHGIRAAVNSTIACSEFGRTTDMWFNSLHSVESLQGSTDDHYKEKYLEDFKRLVEEALTLEKIAQLCGAEQIFTQRNCRAIKYHAEQWRSTCEPEQWEEAIEKFDQMFKHHYSKMPLTSSSSRWGVAYLPNFVVKPDEFEY